MSVWAYALVIVSRCIPTSLSNRLRFAHDSQIPNSLAEPTSNLIKALPRYNTVLKRSITGLGTANEPTRFDE